MILRSNVIVHELCFQMNSMFMVNSMFQTRYFMAFHIHISVSFIGRYYACIYVCPSQPITISCSQCHMSPLQMLKAMKISVQLLSFFLCFHIKRLSSDGAVEFHICAPLEST